METFELRKSCNELLVELNKLGGRQNIIKLGIDIQLPELFIGKSDELIRPLKTVSKFVGEALINGIVNIEISAQSRHNNTINTHLQVVGNGSHRLVLSDIDKFSQSFESSLTHSVKEDQLTIEFEQVLYLGEPVPPTPINPPFKDKRILLAEDNEINAMVFDSFLEEWGCKSQLAINGAEAVALVHEQRYDAILMDVFMPVLDGQQATYRIREFNSTVPIVALTASTREDDIKGILDAGANDYLIKPVSSAQLYQVLSKYLC